jgi:hypothetical protein
MEAGSLPFLFAEIPSRRTFSGMERAAVQQMDEQ